MISGESDSIIIEFHFYYQIPKNAPKPGQRGGRPTEEHTRDRLFVEGVRSRGYGLIPKAVMLDPGLSASAKGLYAFFASFTGSGNTAFPGRDTILNALGLCKDAYYRHMQELTALDYIRIQTRKQQGRFDGNLYILVEKPSRFRETVPVVGEGDCAIIRAEGLCAAGFGFIPKAIMLDRALSIKSKALYAYLSSFCGAGSTACPGKDVILYHLCMGKDAYAAALKGLRQQNYVTVTQRHSGGKLGNLEFTLVIKPELQTPKLGAAPIQAAGKQDAAFQDTEISDADFLLPEKQDTAQQDRAFQDTPYEDTDIQDTNNNSSNNNSLYQYPSYHQQSAHPLRTKREAEGRTSTQIEFLCDAGDALQNHEALTRKLVETLCRYRDTVQEYEDMGTAECGISRDFYYMFVDAMIALLSQPETVLGRDRIPQERIIWQLSRYINRVEPGALLSFGWETEQEYQEAIRKTEPRFPQLFLKRLIVNRLTEGNMRIQGEAIHDWAQE